MSESAWKPAAPATAGPDLLDQHAQLIEASAIPSEVAAARGYRSITSKAELERLGFSRPQRITPALLIPIHDVHGEIATYQIRPDTPRVGRRGRPIKYETPKKSRMVLDVPPGARRWIGDPSLPLLITEGARKADSAVGIGLCCIALLGVWNWRGRNDNDGLTALAAFDAIALNGRLVYLAFDSDALTNKSVALALDRLRRFITTRKATVRILQLPAGDGGVKTGLDDFIAAGHGLDALFSCALDDDAVATRVPQEIPTYETTARGFVYNKPVRGGVIPTPLANFNARIRAEVETDDGAETSRSFEIETDLLGVTSVINVTARQFHGMAWAVEHLGASAILYPGFGLRDHTRTAIQMLSKDIERRRVYSHSGWRRVDDAWVYLHGAGAIGPAGLLGHIQVALPEGLEHYALPDPADRDAVRDGVTASLGFLDLAPHRITAPLLAAPFRAVLGDTDFSLHVTGPTGEGKTAVSALVQQHFGAGLDAEHLPGSWQSTGNALEALAFATKDALFVVDDFVPHGSGADAQRLHQTAERLLRAKGNSSGRQRMRADASLRAAKPPRALVLSTGEDIPRGHSLRSRALIIEVAPGDVDWDLLTRAQKQAGSGHYSMALAGYLTWLAPQARAIQKGLHDEVRRQRDRIFDRRQHRRTAFIAAELFIGFEYFLRFARESGAIDPERYDRLRDAMWAGLSEAAESQHRHHQSEEPTVRFLDLLAAALASGRAHVAAREGGPPESPRRWGWRQDDVDRSSTAQPQGERVGWVEQDDLYLEPEASFGVVQRLAREQGESITIASQTLRKRLNERRHLKSTDTGRATLTVRRTLDGVRRSVLHLHAVALHRRQPDQPDQETGREPKASESGAGQWSGQWSGSDQRPDQSESGTRPEHPDLARDDEQEHGRGRVGQSDERTDSPPEPTGVAPSPSNDAEEDRCRACGSDQQWVGRHGARVCGQCHPPPSPDSVTNWIHAPSDGGQP